MNRAGDYEAAAQAYADGVRVLFAGSGVPTGERGGRGPVSYEDLAAQAEQLAPLSAELTEAAAERVTDPAVSMEVATGLLAKALTDVQVGAYLLQAAQDQEDELEWADDLERERSRSGAVAADRDELLQFVLGQAEPEEIAVDRGRPPRDISEARITLSHAVEDTLDLISERASRTGQSALGGLLGMGAGKLREAAGMLGTEIATALGQAEKITRLYKLFQDYVSNAIESVIALVGKDVAEMAASQALDWLADLSAGKLMHQVLEKLYETQTTARGLEPLISSSERDLEAYIDAIADVDHLEGAHRRQIKLADKLLSGFGLLGGVPLPTLPALKLALAAAHIALGAYVVLSAADYVDAQRLKLIDRVPGVSRVVVARLAVPGAEG